MTRHAAPEDCPCCHDRLTPGDDTDRALVIAFLGGVTAHQEKVPIAEALCAKHAASAKDCLTTMLGVARAVATMGRS